MDFNLEIFSAFTVLIIIGLFGNLFGLIVISKKKLNKIGPQITYIAMFIFDWVNFVTIFQPYLLYSFNIDVTIVSSLACKSYWYIGFAFAPIPSMLNVYISIERFISLAYPSKKYILLKNKIQLAYIIALTLLNIGLYVPIGIYYDLVAAYNQTVCDYVDVYWLKTCGYIDLINRVIIPSLLMIIFSLLIIMTIFKSRTRITSNIRANRTFQKDVKLSIISIMINISYILFSLPVSILVLFPNFLFNPLYIYFNCVYFLSYSSNFYLIFTANSLFRRGFYYLFCTEPQTHQQ